jgi:hypothetical protein
MSCRVSPESELIVNECFDVLKPLRLLLSQSAMNKNIEEINGKKYFSLFLFCITHNV